MLYVLSGVLPAVRARLLGDWELSLESACWDLTSIIGNRPAKVVSGPCQKMAGASHKEQPMSMTQAECCKNSKLYYYNGSRREDMMTTDYNDVKSCF